MWTKQRNRSGKSSTESKMFPYSVGAEYSVQSLLQRRTVLERTT